MIILQPRSNIKKDSSLLQPAYKCSIVSLMVIRTDASSSKINNCISVEFPIRDITGSRRFQPLVPQMITFIYKTKLMKNICMKKRTMFCLMSQKKNWKKPFQTD